MLQNYYMPEVGLCFQLQNIKIDHIFIGELELVLAIYKDNLWYRCKVLAVIDETHIKVYKLSFLRKKLSTQSLTTIVLGVLLGLWKLSHCNVKVSVPLVGTIRFLSVPSVPVPTGQCSTVSRYE